jgi:para-nitrobenzyl esterase
MAGTDRVQTEPARFTARAFVAKAAPAYVYRFSYVPAAMKAQWRNGVPHGAEVPYAFDMLGAGPGATPPAPEDEAVARTVNTYWANFAKTVTRTVRACRSGPGTIPAKTRSSSSDPTERRWLRPILGRRGWT